MCFDKVILKYFRLGNRFYFLDSEGASTANSDESKYVKDLADPLILAIADGVWDAVKERFKNEFWDKQGITWHKVTMVR